MNSWKVPLSDVVLTEEDIDVVADVYRSGWLSLGPCTKRLEERLSEYVGTRHTIAVSSGTAALHLMCLGVGLGPGDEVVVPSMTFVATVNAIAYTGAAPVFADIASPLEPWLSADAALAAKTERTKGVMTMSYGGHPGEVAELSRGCAARGLWLLEDSAHGLGSRLDERHLGSFGVAGAFSFFSNKNLAVGEGGAVATDDDELAARVRLLRSHGMTSLSWDRHKGHASSYDVAALGFNYRIDEPRAALAAHRLQRLDADNERRRELDARYRGRFAELGIDCPLSPGEGVSSACHLFCILLPAGADRDEFRAKLTAAGIQTSMHYPPVHEFSIYAPAHARLPVTDAYARRAVTLPLYAHMSIEQQDQVLSAVELALARQRA